MSKVRKFDYSKNLIKQNLTTYNFPIDAAAKICRSHLEGDSSPQFDRIAKKLRKFNSVKLFTKPYQPQKVSKLGVRIQNWPQNWTLLFKMKLYWLKWLTVWVALVRGCPEECRCDSRKRVYCNNRNLSELPRNIPADTKVLFLQDNRLTNTLQLEQELARLTKLERLEFFNNNLESIPKLNSINLRELHLSNNR